MGSLAEWRRNLETRPRSRDSVTLILLTREEGYTRGSLLKSLVAVVDNGDDTEECPLDSILSLPREKNILTPLRRNIETLLSSRR